MSQHIFVKNGHWTKGSVMVQGVQALDFLCCFVGIHQVLFKCKPSPVYTLAIFLSLGTNKRVWVTMMLLRDWLQDCCAWGKRTPIEEEPLFWSTSYCFWVMTAAMNHLTLQFKHPAVEMMFLSLTTMWLTQSIEWAIFKKFWVWLY